MLNENSKIFAFSKEIDKCLLLKYFLRKSTIGDSGDLFINGENLGTFLRHFCPYYDFLHFCHIHPLNCIFSIQYGLHTQKIVVHSYQQVKVIHLSNF